MEAHKEWLTNEYGQWQQALQESTIENFKQHPAVIRMIGLEDEHTQFVPLIKDLDLPWAQLEAIDKIGKPPVVTVINGVRLSGVMLRYIYYSIQLLKRLNLFKENSIIEVGGGYGGFASALHHITKHKKVKIDHYTFIDLPEPKNFQYSFLQRTCQEYCDHGIKQVLKSEYGLLQTFVQSTHFVSFYSLGEMDNDTKREYIHQILSKIPHGFIIWNAHSGADDSCIELIKKYHPTLVVTPEDPLTSPGNLQLTW